MVNQILDMVCVSYLHDSSECHGIISKQDQAGEYVNLMEAVHNSNISK